MTDTAFSNVFFGKGSKMVKNAKIQEKDLNWSKGKCSKAQKSKTKFS